LVTDLTYDRLLEFIKSKIDFGELTLKFMDFDGVGGMTTTKNGHTLIIINSRMCPEKQLRSFIHEAIHVYYNHDTNKRDEFENITSSATNTVLKNLREDNNERISKKIHN
jgi:hypothetical protein